MTKAGVYKICREIFGDAKGVISWGHVASSVALVAAIVWVSRVLYLTHALPALDGITGFVVAPYVSNKAATAAQAFSQNPVTTPAPPSIPPPPPMLPPQ